CALVAATLLLPIAAPARQFDDEITVSAARFYRADASLTQVKAFVQVPLALLTVGANDTLAFRVTVQLKDSTGLKLAEEAWPLQHVAGAMQEPGAFTVNSVEFNIRPGKYRLDVAVEDSVTGRQLTTGTDLVGYPTRPEASDLVLSTRMRPFVPDSAVLDTEWKSGQILVTSIARVRLNPTQPSGSRIFYLLEAYTAAPDSGTMQVRIQDATGKTFVQAAPTPVHLGTGGGVLRGQLNLEGLPSGTYTFHVVVVLASGTTERAAAFSMGDLQAELQRVAAAASARLQTDEGYFAAMDEAQLRQAAEPLEYLTGSRELRPFSGLSLDGKRRFLTEFWQKRDPEPTTPRNEAREMFYGKIAYADSAYRERSAAATPGWKTDRGRIYAKYGSPDETLNRVRSGKAPSYSVWHYTRRRDTYFVFADRSGLDDFQMMMSNDRSEPGSPSWRDILGSDAIRDIGLFLSIDFFTTP
ncbi:MAG: GWxTD domain-containing protein, partial [Gemmatimonadota bacterium]